jgi:hypothetical protein
LIFQDVSPEESGYYRCVSKNLNRGSLNIGAIEMIVKQNDGHVSAVVEEAGSDADIIKIILIVISLLVLLLCGFFIYRLRKEDKKIRTKLAAFGINFLTLSY